ncbi:MAG: signal peptidase I [Parcubacteria group bacterium]
MKFYEDNYFENMTAGQKVLRFIWDLLKVVCVSLAIIIPVRYFLIQPFYVKGASMEPSFYDREYLIINELVYRFNDPGRGDIVIFKYPKDPSQYFIKRIVGLPGEKVEVKDNQVFVSQGGRKAMLDEAEYIGPSVRTFGDKSLQLGSDEYFVMGDNRDNSLDSRNFGPVAREMIVGKVWLRGWPVWRLDVFENVNYPK